MICQTPLTQAKVKYILSPINDIKFSDRVQFETGQFHPYGPYSASTFRRTVQIETGNFQTVSDCVYWTTLVRGEKNFKLHRQKHDLDTSSGFFSNIFLYEHPHLFYIEAPILPENVACGETTL